MIDRLNNPIDERASGITAPLIRAAAHVGYILGYLDEMDDETFTARRAELVTDMNRELNEANRHLRDSAAAATNPYVSTATTDLCAGLRISIDTLRASPPQEQSDILRDLVNLNHNIAYVGAMLDKDTAGLDTAHEGSRP